MGYTHYWYRKTLEFPMDKWKLFIVDMKKVLVNLPETFEGDGNKGHGERIILGDMEGRGNISKNIQPILNDDEISFNGVGDNAHESFRLNRKFKMYAFNIERWKDEKKVFDCCKTARKPYSFVVEIALLLAQFYFDIEISSDGDDGDWRFAYNYLLTNFPEKAVLLELVK